MHYLLLFQARIYIAQNAKLSVTSAEIISTKASFPSDTNFKAEDHPNSPRITALASCTGYKQSCAPSQKGLSTLQHHVQMSLITKLPPPDNSAFDQRS